MMSILEANQINVEGHIDPAFRRIYKNTVGFMMWKAENDRIECLSKQQYGIFYTNRNYIVYAANVTGQIVDKDSICREVKRNNEHIDVFIHFWLGEQTTAEKSGQVAYKIMELDNHIGLKSSLYRESQGNESSRFQSYFKDGIILLNDESTDRAVGRLFVIKGKVSPVCTEKTSISWEHFNSNRIIILQTSAYMFVWIGAFSSSSERLSGLRIAKKLQIIYSVDKLAIIDDGYEQSMDADRKVYWNKYLQFALRNVQPAEIRPPKTNRILKLYKCEVSGTKYTIIELKSSNLLQNDIDDSHASYIIDCGERGVWIWVGQTSTARDKKEAMRNARGFVKKKKYPNSTQVIRIIEGREPIEFTSLFPYWQHPELNGNIPANVVGKFDALTLIQRPRLAFETQLIDDGSGELNVYYISKSGTIVPLKSDDNIAFFSRDCYMLHYYVAFQEKKLKSLGPQINRHIVYTWEGSQSTPEAHKHLRDSANKLVASLEDGVMMVKVTEGSEPPHFLQIFQGKFVVFKGSAKNFETEITCTSFPQEYIVKVSGSSTYTGYSHEIVSAESIQSQHCYIIRRTGHDNIWIWCGQHSTGDNRELAKSLGGMFGEYALALAKKEPKEFWKFIGTELKQSFLETQKLTSQHTEDHEFLIKLQTDINRVGLYVCSSTFGNIAIDRILNYMQTDLAPEDIYLLDIGNMVYLWIGEQTGADERALCLMMATQFLTSSQSNRSTTIPISIIRQGYEPITFIGAFDSWDSKRWINHKPFEMERIYLDTQSKGPQMRNNNFDDSFSNEFDKFPKYPLFILRSDPSTIPAAIDPQRKEMYLTHDDFIDVFKMSYDKFDALPNWRKQDLKKLNKLF